MPPCRDARGVGRSRTRTRLVRWTPPTDFPCCAFASEQPSGAPGWSENHSSAAGVWVSIAKKGTGIESVRYPEVLEHAICFGWIDGRRERLDDARFLQRFTPRRARSPWSRINREKAELLGEQGLMAPAGLERGAPGQGGRPLGAGVRVATHRRGARGPAARARRAPGGRRRVRRAERAEPLLDPLPARPGAPAADARARRLAEYVRMLEAGETLQPGSAASRARLRRRARARVSAARRGRARERRRRRPRSARGAAAARRAGSSGSGATASPCPGAGSSSIARCT